MPPRMTPAVRKPTGLRRRVGSMFLVGCLQGASWSATACSPAPLAPMHADPAYAYDGEVAPGAPVARVVEIVRGSAPVEPGSCDDAGTIVIAVRDDSVRGYHGYAFQQVSGDAPDAIFPSGTYFGGPLGDELIFAFYWLDPDRN